MRNIIITGGELFNKGAQAMTFVAVDECRKRFPDHEIYLLSTQDIQRPEKEKKQYNFRFMGWYPLKFAKAQKSFFLRTLCRILNAGEYQEAMDIYKQCDLMIDISGYALGSNWGYAHCNNYLDHLEYARSFHIPVYLMPQSFGPFDFEGNDAGAMQDRIRTNLAYVRKICAREQEGYDELTSRYGLDNVELKTDIVLNNKGIDLQNIYKVLPDLSIPKLEANSIGIIPNERMLDFSSEKELLDLYHNILKEMISQDRTVYIISHSTSDLGLCRKIKALYPTEDRVVLFENDFSCIEYTELIKQLDFVVASRFHSIVHAYKEGVPCVTIGWAVKYGNLLKKFDQTRYYHDIRTLEDNSLLVESLLDMSSHYRDQSRIIKKHLSGIQEENVFDILKL